jgi:PII-like signaling protein
MKTQAQAQALRIYLGALDKHGHRPLYEVIVEKARKRGLAGATVLRAIMGFGASRQVHTAKILRLSEDVPVVIEIVDKPERIEAFLPDIGDMLKKGLVTLETVDAIAYRHNKSQSPT